MNFSGSINFLYAHMLQLQSINFMKGLDKYDEM